MPYPGDPSLDPSVQQRVMTAFAEAVRLFREGHPEGTRTVLRSILEVDPNFQPGQRLWAAIEGGGSLDLSQLLGELAAVAPPDTEGGLGRAREAMARRDFQAALSRAQAVLRELPGHAEARQIALDAQQRLRAAGEIDAHIARVEETLSSGMIDEAKSFLGLARTLDPTHPKVAELENRLQQAGAAGGGTGFEFEVFEHAPDPDEPIPPAPTDSAGEMLIERTGEETFPSAAGSDLGTPPPAAADAAAAAFAFDGSAGAGGLSFEAPPPAAAAAPVAAGEPAASETADRIAALLEQGQQAFDARDWRGAIDAWSRVFLIDPHNQDAEARVEQARRCLEETDRLAEHRFYEAREAFDQGRKDEARRLCEEVLTLQPQHLDAQDLLARLDVPAAAPPPPAAPPLVTPTPQELDEELFRDDFVPASSATLEEGLAGGLAPAPAATARAPRPRRRFSLAVPLPVIGAVVGLVVLVAVTAFLLRGKVFSGGGDVVAKALAEAEQTAQQGRLQDAINLLKSVQDQSEGEQAQQLSQRLLEYQRQLKAISTPARTVDVGPIREALAAGQRLKALRLVREMLAQVPGEPALVEEQAILLDYARSLPQLADAQAGRRWEAVRNLSGEILKAHPDDAEVRRLWEAATFNLAVTHLRKYQVAPAQSLFDELVKATGDPEAAQHQRFAAAYLSRPTDPRYQIYVGNIELRVVE